MPIRGGNEVVLKVGGQGISFDNEPTNTDDNRIYTIADSSKQIFDINNPIDVYNGGEKVTEDFMVDYVNGSIIFSNSSSRLITVSGYYVTTSAFGLAHKYSLKETVDIYDITNFGSTYKKKMAGEKEASGSISDFETIDSYYRDALLMGKPILIEISHFDGDTKPKRLWALLDSQDVEASIGNPQEATISFQSTGKF